MIGTKKKPKTDGKITYSEFFHSYIVIYFDPDSEKNVITRKSTQQEAEEFLNQQNKKNLSRQFWWDKE